MKTIIGIVGTIASGKDTLSKYISKKLNIPHFHASKELFETAKAEKIPINRENLNALAFKLSNEKGEDYLVRTIFSKVKGKIAVISGLRQISQIAYLQKKSKLILISIDAKPQIRFQRAMMKSKMNDSDDLMSDSDSERIVCLRLNLRHLFECMSLAKYHLRSDDGREKLFADADLVLDNEKLINIKSKKNSAKKKTSLFSDSKNASTKTERCSLEI